MASMDLGRGRLHTADRPTAKPVAVLYMEATPPTCRHHRHAVGGEAEKEEECVTSLCSVV